ncbi:hypothetical protein B7494_g5288 [Chlorociboria aeruginascens]|nr:hypothetical protein B7494_g5288 [Chlorociboria aeruginascens]
MASPLTLRVQSQPLPASTTPAPPGQEIMNTSPTPDHKETPHSMHDFYRPSTLIDTPTPYYFKEDEDYFEKNEDSILDESILEGSEILPPMNDIRLDLFVASSALFSPDTGDWQQTLMQEQIQQQSTQQQQQLTPQQFQIIQRQKQLQLGLLGVQQEQAPPPPEVEKGKARFP